MTRPEPRPAPAPAPGQRGGAQPRAVFPGSADFGPYAFRRGAAHVVRYLNPTANKPLHLGHLRNIALGTAIAGSMRALGIDAVRHCVIEDTGRWMCEAMAAFAELKRAGTADAAVHGHRKPDQFVGAIYARHRRALREARAGAAAAGPGYDVRDDAADDLQRALLDGAREARALRDEVKALALAGQQATLRRLGATFDHCDYESVEDVLLADFVGDGLRAGIFAANADGEVVYANSSRLLMRMVNRLGLYEESARLLCYLRRRLRDWPPDCVNVIVAGSEWKGWMDFYPEILARFGIVHARAMYAHAFYGMVRLDGRKMASSAGPGVLVDDLLDELADSGLAQTIAGECGLFSDAVAATAVKAFLLAVPRVRAIDYAEHRVKDPASNRGWAVARAWGRCRGSDATVAPGALEALREALTRLSFERAVAMAGRLADRVLAGEASADEAAAFVALTKALGLAPEHSDFAYAAAPPLPAALDPPAVDGSRDRMVSS